MTLEKLEILNHQENLPIPKSCFELLEDFKQREEKEKIPPGEKLKFEGVGDKDVYNPTAPFEVDGVTYILGRVESRHSEIDTESIFFTEKDGVWSPDKSKLVFKMQDPFVTKIDNEIIVGGVETSPAPTPKNADALTWKTVFYKGKNLNDLEKFAEGPEGMKGIRIIKLRNGKILVSTRPGSVGSREKDGIGGKIGFTIIDSLDELNVENINKSKIIEGLFTEGEWGGTNELHLLDDNKVGVLGHKACFKNEEREEKKCYYGITFVFDLESEQVSGEKIMATAECFGKGEAKRENLKNVFYPGGLKIENNEVMLYGGVRDTEAGRKKVANSLENLFS